MTRTSRRAPVRLGWIAVGVLGLSGCGASSGPTRAGFLAQANGVCQRANGQVAAAGQAKTPADVMREGPVVIAIEQRALAQLRAIQPPSSLRADYRQLLGDLGQLTVHVGELLAAARAQSTAAANQAAVASEQIQTQITQIATRDGLTQCAKG